MDCDMDIHERHVFMLNSMDKYSNNVHQARDVPLESLVNYLSDHES